MKRLFQVIYSKKLNIYIRKIDYFIKVHMPKFSGFLQKYRDIVRNNKPIQEECLDSDDLLMDAKKQPVDDIYASIIDSYWNEEQEVEISNPLVSIIVPNYNHAQFLEQRLQTIYQQSYSNYEVILLDDCSSDNSKEILNKYARLYPNITTTLYNDENVGVVFEQWNRGLKIAKGELIWIAESDDYSDTDFLNVMVKQFKYSSTMLAFCRSDFMQNGEKIWTTEEYLGDLSMLNWSEPFIMSSAEIVKRGFCYKNIIPNVSSCLFRRVSGIDKEVIRTCKKMILSSDWIFYLDIIKGGTIAYTNEITNYYRVHEHSTSLRVQHSLNYYIEYEKVTRYILKNYAIDNSFIDKTYEYLKWHYSAMNGTDDVSKVNECFNVGELKKVNEHRKPNIAMATFSLQTGGGEIYPLYLANSLKELGCNVCVYDFNLGKYEEGCRRILNSNIPLIRLKDVGLLVRILKKQNIDVIHSHHGSVDEIIGTLLAEGTYDCRHVITLHGMYEMIEEKYLPHLLEVTGKSCSKFFYISNKNLLVFKKYNLLKNYNFQKIDNGLPDIKINKIERSKLDIDEEAFVITLASRGILEKGWKEAIEAVGLARNKININIQLVFLGDGEAKELLEKDAPDFCHFEGYKENVRDYFAMSDLAILPSYYKGESFPLSVIEALKCHIPVIASNMGEIEYQLKDDNDELAGYLINCDDGKISIDEFTDKIVEIVENKDIYQMLKQRTFSAAKKFNINRIAGIYLQVYKEVTGLFDGGVV